MKDFIVIHPSDNVGIALKVLEQGDEICAIKDTLLS